MASSRIIWNGNPGEVWVNNGQTIRYQLICKFANSCGYCIQYHLAISNWWPLKFHKKCRCRQLMVLPGASAQPFENFREILDNLSWDQKVEAVGGACYKLLEHGTITWDQLVTETRVRSLKEIVSRQKLSIDAMESAGVSPGRAKQAIDAINTPAAKLIRERRAELVDRLRAGGLSDAQIKEGVARKIAQRISTTGGRGETFPPTTVGPKPSTLPPDLLERINRTARANRLAFPVAGLPEIRAKILANVAAGIVKPIPKPAEPKPAPKVPVVELPLPMFAREVMTAAESVPIEARWAEKKVWIIDAFKRFAVDHPDATLEQFKELLLDANREGFVTLTRMDMPGALSKDERLKDAASEARIGPASFHLIRLK